MGHAQDLHLVDDSCRIFAPVLGGCRRSSVLNIGGVSLHCKRSRQRTWALTKMSVPKWEGLLLVGLVPSLPLH